MNSQSPSADGQFAQIQIFPIVIPLGGEDQSLAIDFSAMISAGRPQDAIAPLAAHKLYEMNDASRKAFKLKLAAFVGRP